MIIGIDLGTTNSLCAHMTEGGPRLIPNALGDYMTPSVVGFDHAGTVVVGKSARELQVKYPDRCAAAFKRHIGTEWQTTIAEQRLNAVELSAHILRSLRSDAEAFIGRPVDQAVITVPAYFDDKQRKATIQAGKVAGLKVHRIINEPTAAAIAYGLHDGDEDKVALVFDLGGGTFDVSIVDLFDGAVEIRSSAGEVFLGGEDFTSELLKRVLMSQGETIERAEMTKPLAVSRLRHQCDQAKRALTAQPETSIRIPDDQGNLTDQSQVFPLTRSQFEEFTEPILARAETPIRKAMLDAKLLNKDLDEVILVGGATRMPSVAKRVMQLFEKAPRCRLNPDEVVAVGAAVQAGLIANDAAVSDLVVTDVAPFTLGISVCQEVGFSVKDGYYAPIINRNTTIPISRVEQFHTMTDNQTKVQIDVYQGENRMVSENCLITTFEITDIPPGPAGRPVNVRFTYDLNGILEVEAAVEGTDEVVSHLIKEFATGMSDEDIDEAARKLDALKTHPREDAKNLHILRWAERIYTELTMIDRMNLASLLQRYESALELQDPDLIERTRGDLYQFLRAIDGDSDDAIDGYEEPTPL